jgi:predicted TIM-barrel fold metal-dependent hydrolase
MAEIGTKPRDVTAGLKVIDTDAHWAEPPDLWTSRAPAKFRDRVPQMRRVDGTSVWIADGDIDLGYAVLGVVKKGGEKFYGGLTLSYFEDLDPACSQAKPRVKVLDDLGLWAQVLYPNAAGFSATKFMQRLRDAELGLQCIKIYNDAAAQLQRDSGNRLFPQALGPLWDMAETVREARRCTEDLGLTGVCLTDNVRSQGCPEFVEPWWQPFWEWADATRTPINFHSGGTLIDVKAGIWNTYAFAGDGFGGGESMALQAAMSEMSNASVIGNFLYSGLFDRYPHLQFVSVESGIGWLPFYLENLEYQYAEMVLPENRRITKPIRQAFREHYHVCFWFESAAPRLLIEEIGANNIMFETDYPHPTCLYPEPREHVNRVMAGLDDHTCRRILQDNASELYRLPGVYD